MKLTISDSLLMELYGPSSANAPARIERVRDEFRRRFGGEARLFSAPGRTEIGGNHTDHQMGYVLAAAVSLDTLAAALPNGSDTVRLISDGYDKEFRVELGDDVPHEAEFGTTEALIRGVMSRMKALGHGTGGFNAYVSSTVLSGSGLSSSAAFEVLICAIADHLFGGGDMSGVEAAQIAQFAENRYFGKPCGLMDQTASAVGGLVAIDFHDKTAKVQQVPFDFAACGYLLVVSNTGGSHGDLTRHYADITLEMTSVARSLGAEKLAYAKEEALYANLGDIARKFGERAALRAIHFFEDDRRVPEQAAALERGDFAAFLSLVKASGDSSWKYLQNLYVPGGDERIPLSLALSAKLLGGRGASRVHGGGFAGTIQAFVPEALIGKYISGMEAYLAKGACTVLSIRPYGFAELV